MYGVDTRAHVAGPMPPAAAAVDYTGGNLPAEDDAPALSYFRTFRPAETAGRMPTPGTDAPLSAQLAEHMQPGTPDPRRDRQTMQATSRDLEAQTESRANTLLPVAFAATAAPDRTRGGLNGYDPARPATTRRNLFVRAFDQWAGGLPGVKASFASPSASRGLIQPDDVPGALPTGNSGRGDRKAGVGPQRNTFRLMPRAWDTDLVVGDDSAGGAAAAAAAQVRAGWRAR